MNRTSLLIIVIVLAFAGGIVWFDHQHLRSQNTEAAQKPANEPEGLHVTRDNKGNAIVNISDEAQGEMGIKVEKPEAASFSPEIKAYGRVQDPGPLAALTLELASAEAAYSASSNELARLQTLQGQGNASARALQTAEAAALHDRLATQAARDKLLLSWGENIPRQPDISAFVQSLTSREAALIRVDLPAGENLAGPSRVARIVTLSGRSGEAAFLDAAPAVDPQLQGRAFLFLMKPNQLKLSPGESLIAFLPAPGEPLTGIMVPRQAVVRAEGAAWVYVLSAGSDAFTRTEIPLEHPTETGWFVAGAISPTNYIVTTAAQQLLSIEMKGQGAE